jgi:hypothetical protein
MGFIAYDTTMGVVKLTDIDTVGPGPVNLVAGTGAGRQSFSFEIMRGYDAALGGGSSAARLRPERSASSTNRLPAARSSTPQLHGPAPQTAVM